MNNIIRPEPWWKDHQPPKLPPEPPDMEQRVARLEALTEKNGERLAVIERDIAVMKSNYSTKEDLAALRGDMKAAIAEAKNTIIMWVVSALFLAQVFPALLKKLGL